MKPTVIVTGFGPFRNPYRDITHRNASWESAKLLVIDEVDLIKQEIEVAYEAVDKDVCDLWTKYNPALVIHCGVSHLAQGLVLETLAHSTGYVHQDVRGCTQGPCEDQGTPCEQFKTKLDLAAVCDKINAAQRGGAIKLSAQVSTNAGRYLCEYIYFCSLKRDSGRTVFVHVPELSKFSAEDISLALDFAIRAILENMNILRNDVVKAS